MAAVNRAPAPADGRYGSRRQTSTTQYGPGSQLPAAKSRAIAMAVSMSFTRQYRFTNYFAAMPLHDNEEQAKLGTMFPGRHQLLTISLNRFPLSSPKPL